MNILDIYQQRQTQAVIAHIVDAYQAEPEFLWKKYPGFCIFRNERNRKWFALVMRIPASRLGLDDDREVEVMNLRFDRHEALDFASSHQNFFPAYHMNKGNWYSVLLDGKLDDEVVFELVERSFGLVN